MKRRRSGPDDLFDRFKMIIACTAAGYLISYGHDNNKFNSFFSVTFYWISIFYREIKQHIDLLNEEIQNLQREIENLRSDGNRNAL